MEEKNLTDEEVIKGLECCSKGCRDKSCFGSEMYGIADCTNILTKNALDLIHRLQSENERLSLIAGMIDKGVAVEIVNMQETIDKQKAEIERLTKLVDKWENAYGDEYWMAKHNEILKGILQEVDKESNGQTISVTNVLRKRYGVEVE